MKIRMKAALTGFRDGARWPGIGLVLIVSDAEGADLCAAGLADPVADTAPERAGPPSPDKRAPAARAGKI